ncbi:MAG: tetratricopeptide repeat protein [Dysgonamonadaceae bacterium]|jgi:tetratricopeptide (TPR) repeat protein|nr:tetratricopeptide repeat protein [Dysgonamonadaceae bacterium]
MKNKKPISNFQFSTFNVQFGSCLLLIAFVFLTSCTSTKNTAGTRWYHSFNTRFNVYFNGQTAYDAAFKAQEEAYKDNFSEMILMFPASSLPKEKPNTGGPFDKSIEKSVKAIKRHSIQTKPEAKPAKRNNPKYKAWMERTEYNPFLYRAWMLMAQSQFYNGDFLQAASSFSYIARLYITQPEIAVDAKIWFARCYAEIAWYYEAEDILAKVKREGIPNQRLQDWFDTVTADLLLKQKSYKEAVPYLQAAIRSEKNKVQKNREKYLLGQIYSKLGEKQLAYKTFGEVYRATVPYPLEFSARIRQTEVYTGGDTTKITKQLRKMAKSDKNKDYLDQIYYALGNVYMTVPDTAKAIFAYEKGVELSTQQGKDKAFNQIQLGDIYFEQRQFIKAQPNYSEALPQLKKEDEAYPRVAKRSAVLDELVVHVEAVNLQDSLLRLSQMTEEEQLAIVNKIIEDLKKKEAEEQAKKDREDYLAKQDEIRAEMNTGRPNPKSAAGMVTAPTEEGLFYFYNSQVVAVGKTTFQQKWGKRKAEDDWRRRNKTNPLAEITPEDTEMPETEETLASNDSIPSTDENIAGETTKETSSDPHEPQFYLQQIPKTEEDIAASNLIISDGLYNMGVIYKDKLEDKDLALETFDELNTRYPNNENKLDAYYHIYLIYWKLGDTATANLWKQKIRTEFPESDLAIAMADPDYEYNLQMMEKMQETLYQATYQSYLDGEVEKVRENYQTVLNKYSQAKLMPKFLFLNALTYAQAHDTEGFKEQLKALINKFPEADVAILAAEMMKGFQRGLVLSASGDNMLARGGLFNIHWGIEGDVSAGIAAIPFSTETNTPHEILIIYSQGSIDDNLLLYTVASFNFGNFVRRDFGLERTTVGQIGLLQIQGFNNHEEAMQYISMIYGADGYAAGLERSVVVAPISLENYAILAQGKSLEDYMTFFETTFGKENQQLVERWKAAQAYELEVVVETPVENPSSEENFENLKDHNDLKESISEEAAEETPKEKTAEEQKAGELEKQAEELFDKTEEMAGKVNAAIDEFANDPFRKIIEFFQNLFTKKPKNAIDEYVKQQEKEEKARLKQEKQEKAAKEKAAKKAAKEKEKARKKANK